MPFQELLTASQKYFPDLQVKYKNESWLMQLIGKIFFFNSDFMTNYTTTIGSTVYFPSNQFVKLHPVSSCIVLLHELVHLYDQKKVSQPLFAMSYLFPQVLAPIFALLMFLVTWKIMLPLMILCVLPIPGFFRMYWEKRAYLSSFYMMQSLGKKLQFDPHLESQEKIFLSCFHGSSYYFMWPFHDIDKQFDKARETVASGQRPFEDPVFDMLEDLVNKV